MDVRHIAALLLVVWCAVAPCQRTYNRQCQCEYTVNGQCAYTLMLPADRSCPTNASSGRQVDDLQRNVSTLSAVALQQSERLGRLQDHVLDVQSRLASLSEKLNNNLRTPETQQDAIRTIATDLTRGLRRNNETLTRVQYGVDIVAANVSALQMQADNIEGIQRSLMTRLVAAERTIARWQRNLRLCSERGPLVARTETKSQVSSTYDSFFLGAGQARLQSSSAWCPRK